MRRLAVSELPAADPETWLRKDDDLVLTDRGKPVAIVAPVNEDSVEETLDALRRTRAVAALVASQRRAAELGLDRLTMDEIDAEIAAVRRERRERRTG